VSIPQSWPVRVALAVAVLALLGVFVAAALVRWQDWREEMMQP